MSIVGTPKEVAKGENRVAMTPQSVADIMKLGHECIIQSGAGVAARFSDADYKKAGATVVRSANDLWKKAENLNLERPLFHLSILLIIKSLWMLRKLQTQP